MIAHDLGHIVLGMTIRPGLRGLLLVLLGVATVPVANATNPPPKIATPATAAFNADDLQSLEPGQRNQILALLEAAHIPHGELRGRLWPRREKTYLVTAVDASSLDASTVDVQPRFHVVAFDLAGPSVRRLANDGPFLLDKDEQLQDFDFAAYRLTTNEFAFGLRYKRQRGYAAGFATLEGIAFFRLHDGSIDEILRTSTSYEADLAGEWNDDGTRNRDYHDGSAVIIVQNHKTRGHFDWVKRVIGRGAVTFVWDGESYTMNGPEPLETEELDIFDSE